MTLAPGVRRSTANGTAHLPCPLARLRFSIQRLWDIGTQLGLNINEKEDLRGNRVKAAARGALR
jgi:hypothetical protein